MDVMAKAGNGARGGATAAAGRIADDVKDRVRGAHDITEVIGREIELRRVGSSFEACCPFHEERTPSFKVSPDRQRFKCFGCGAGGDVIDWVRARRSVSFPEAVRILAAEQGLAVDGRDASHRDAVPAPVARPAPRSTARLAADEVAALWAASVPANADETMVRWLEEQRGLNSGDVTLHDLVRVIPRGATCPAWAGGTRRDGSSWRWSDSDYRAVFRLFDHTGAAIGARARYIGLPRSNENAPKTLAASGVSTAGIVLADALGVQMLRGEAAPSAVVVVEGEGDLLAAVSALISDGDEDAPAVLGLFQASWSRAIADRVPSGASVRVWTHDDVAGNGYAREVADTLRGRCHLLRGQFPGTVRS